MERDTMNECIVTYGDRGWYRDGVHRQRDSIETIGWHHLQPARWYGVTEMNDLWDIARGRRCVFKLYMIKWARDEGYKRVFWWDSSIWAVRDPDPIFEYVAQHGVYLMTVGEINGTWTGDDCLDILGVSREEALRQPHVVGGFWGVDFSDHRGRKFFDSLWELAHRELSPYDGPRWADWMEKGQRGDYGWVSDDKTVRGHRSDQSVMSILADQQGIPVISAGKGHMQYVYGDDRPYEVRDDVVAVARGGIREDDLNGIPYATS
jgi:hypothetical protein